MAVNVLILDIIGLSGHFPWAEIDNGLNLTTHLHTVPSLRTSGDVTPLRSPPSCRNRNNFACTQIVVRPRPIYSYINTVSSWRVHVKFHTIIFFF